MSIRGSVYSDQAIALYRHRLICSAKAFTEVLHADTRTGRKGLYGRIISTHAESAKKTPDNPSNEVTLDGLSTVLHSPGVVCCTPGSSVGTGPEHCQTQAPRGGNRRKRHGVGRHSAPAVRRQDAQPLQRDQEGGLWQVADCLRSQLPARV